MKTIKIQMSEVWNKRTEPKHNSPVLNYCRKLLSEGEDSKTCLEVYRGELLCLVISDIGSGSKLAIQEDEVYGPRFVKHRPFPDKLKKQGTKVSPSDH